MLFSFNTSKVLTNSPAFSKRDLNEAMYGFFAFNQKRW